MPAATDASTTVPYTGPWTIDDNLSLSVFGLTVEENLRIACRHSRRGQWDTDEVYRLFPRLAERMKNRGDQLSSGEQEMLSIGRALVTNPTLLLMDEPSDGLAPIIVGLIGDTIQTLAARGVTVLLVEQNLAPALRVADEVAVMTKGRVTCTRQPADLRSDQGQLRDLIGVGAWDHAGRLSDSAGLCLGRTVLQDLLNHPHGREGRRRSAVRHHL